ncbi:MAG: hypothetical protein II969_04005 [Anaerolineaceae bacterium]|nr:hypothetical protein [Anaerolineaceae bacterium]
MSGNKKDWKLFRELLPGWQETFMGRLVKEYAAMLNGEGKASDKFWDLEERIKKDKRRPGIFLTLDRAEMEYDLCSLILDGVVTMDDLAPFSEEVRSRVDFLVQSARRSAEEEDASD